MSVTADVARESVVERCICVIESGTTLERYKVLPEISVLRHPRLLRPLLRVLREGLRKDKEFAALALGVMERTECLGALYEALVNDRNHHGAGTQSLQTAIIVAMGEIRQDAVVRYLRMAIDFTFKGDTFIRGRQKLILSAAGHIAQQGGVEALEFLKEYLDSEDHSLRAHALTELSVAYWHRPNEIPDDILQTLFRLTRHRWKDVKAAAISAVADLASLGCVRAEERCETGA
jgi:hypothetical protein